MIQSVYFWGNNEIIIISFYKMLAKITQIKKDSRVPSESVGVLTLSP